MTFLLSIIIFKLFLKTVIFYRIFFFFIILDFQNFYWLKKNILVFFLIDFFKFVLGFFCFFPEIFEII